MRIIKQLLIVKILSLLLILTSGTAQFNFVHLSDIHISDVTSIQNNPDIGGVMFKKVITVIRNLIPKPAFVVASGDISNVGSYGNGMYEALTQHLFPNQITNPDNGDFFIDSAMTIPIYFVPGNHDYFTLPASPVSNSGLINYSNYISPNNDYSISYQNSVIIFIRSGMEEYRPVWIDTNPLEPEGSGISADQCNFIRSVCNANHNNKKIIVMHHPPVNAVGTNADGTQSTGTVLDVADGSIINNRDVLLNICDSANVDMVLAGHVHQNLVADRDGNVVSENFTGGTRYIQTAACLYGAYRIITIDSSFVWAGEPQLITYSDLKNKEITDNNSIEVLENSAQNTLTINCSNVNEVQTADFSIINITGQKVIHQNHILYSGERIVINTSYLPKGFYMLSVISQNINFSKKVIIK